MGKFKVRDKVEIIDASQSCFENGDIGTIKIDDRSSCPYGVERKGSKDIQWYRAEQLKLIDSKPSKKQRIETLEKEVSELKLIVHELRERKVTTVELDGKKVSAASIIGVTIEPSTDEIIEFEGAKYRKVERKAREGDVVIFENVERLKCGTNDNKPYRVVRDHYYKDEDGELTWVYGWNGSCPTPKVYELITEPSTTTTVEDEPKSPNQLRAEVIEKAKGFVEEHCKGFSFGINDSKVRAVSTLAFKEDLTFRYREGYSTCNPSDVFNEHIGKAIALGRALGLDVSEFAQAVQPNEPVVGMVVSDKYDGEEFELSGIRESAVGLFDCKNAFNIKGMETWIGDNQIAKIINDTNAIYGGC